MDYDDFYKTLGELLTKINGAVQDMVGMDTTDTDTPYISYMFDKNDGVFDDTDVLPDDMDSEDSDTGVFTLSPLR